ncbi:hypothetical protein Leryth_003733 [Lithospermum erythrorhizon]|nr:hypothetical protein Leryth_003733 [Lithospermum erythrorhizon]
MAAPAVASKQKTLTPKAIIHQKFGDKACYEIEEVQDSIQNGCPGLAIPQKAPNLYRCRLQLPEISVVSEMFKRKKEAEQSAAEMAMEKLGIKMRECDPTPEEAWDDLVSRLSYLFSSEFFSTLQPLSGHFRAALQRAGKAVESVTLNISLNGYYLDAIAKELGKNEASEVLISRSVGKSSSETRLFSTAAKSKYKESSFLHHENQTTQSEGLFNVRASYLTGQEVHGNAILASIGYTWKSTDIYYEDLSLRSYHRMLANKTPTGIYKLSRDALLVADLPLAFTTKSNWRGSFPRDILCTFCRQHRLGEPLFSFINSSLESLPDLSGSRKKLKVSGSGQDKNGSNIASSSPVICEIKVFSKSQDLLLLCRPNKSYKKQMDAVQSTALKVLSWLNLFLRNKELEKLTELARELEIQFHFEQLLTAFTFCPSVHMSWHQAINLGDSSQKYRNSQPRVWAEDKQVFTNLGGQDLGVFASAGSLACICYTVSLVEKSGVMKEILECNEEFEFEIGTGAVISCLEAVVTQIAVGQTACFNPDLPSEEFLVASAGESSTIFSLLPSRSCKLECTLTLLRVTAPLEDRMEQALFSPPLSKQRVEYAVQHIKESSAGFIG